MSDEYDVPRKSMFALISYARRAGCSAKVNVRPSSLRPPWEMGDKKTMLGKLNYACLTKFASDVSADSGFYKKFAPAGFILLSWRPKANL